MRCTQTIGLSSAAQVYLVAKTATETVTCGCPNCTIPHKKQQISEAYASAASYGMFDDGPELYKYQLKDGTWVYEYVQACPWSSGPCIFLALRDEAGNPILESLWSEDEITNA